MPADIAGLASQHPERLAGVVLCVPTRLDPAPFDAVAARILMVAGENDLTSSTTARAAARLNGSERAVLAGYEALTWADVVADRRAEITVAMTEFLQRVADAGSTASVPRDAPRQGTVAGITYTIEGSGPALCPTAVLSLRRRNGTRRSRSCVRSSPSSCWAAPISAASRRSRTGRGRRPIVLCSGPWSTCSRRNRAIVSSMSAAALARSIGFWARRRGLASPITAMDTNPFLLRAAAALAATDGLTGAIEFVEGNAESLPFEDETFDRAFSITVLEECDADRVLAEIVRVTKPGGRIGVIVRSIDMQQWWHLDLPPEIRAKVDTPPQSVGRKGVADASLYGRMRAAGLRDLVCFPSLVTLDRPEGPIWRYREDHARSLLTAEEMPVWQAAADAAREKGLLFAAHPMHCAVGVKPIVVS